MNTKTIVASLIGGVAFFLLGFLIWGLLLSDMIMSGYMNASCIKPEAEMNMPFIIIANLLWGFVFAYILSNWNGGMSFSKGAIVGAILSVVFGISYDLFYLSMSTIYTGNGIIGINVAGNALVGALVGGLVGWWLGRK